MSGEGRLTGELRELGRTYQSGLQGLNLSFNFVLFGIVRSLVRLGGTVERELYLSWNSSRASGGDRCRCAGGGSGGLGLLASAVGLLSFRGGHD